MNEAAFQVPTAWREAAYAYRQHMGNLKQVHCIVEIGVDYGYSLFTLAKDYPNATVIGIDPYHEYGHWQDARNHVHRFLPDFKNVRLVEKRSEEFVLDWQKPDVYCDIDVLHIDGDHSYEGVKRDYENWARFVRAGGVVLFHDVEAFRDSVGKFFHSLPEKKIVCDGCNLGILFKDGDIDEE